MRSGPFGSSGLGFVGAVDERREARTARGGLSAAASAGSTLKVPAAPA